MYVLPDVIFRTKTVPVKLVVHIFVLLVVIAGERGAEGSYFVPKAPISRTLYHGCTISFKVIVGSVNTLTLYVKWTYSFRQPYWHNAAARPLESDHWPGDLSWRWQYDGLLHHVWITTDELFRFQKKKIDEIRCKQNSTKPWHSFEKLPILHSNALVDKSFLLVWSTYQTPFQRSYPLETWKRMKILKSCVMKVQRTLRTVKDIITK